MRSSGSAKVARNTVEERGETTEMACVTERTRRNSIGQLLPIAVRHGESRRTVVERRRPQVRVDPLEFRNKIPSPIPIRISSREQTAGFVEQGVRPEMSAVARI